MERNQKTSICVSCMKGGTGKTTISCNMAEYFSRRVERVLIIDLDPQAQSCLYFTSEESLCDKDQITLYQLLEFIIRQAAEIRLKNSSVITELRDRFLYSLINRGNISVIASNPDLYDIEPLIYAKTATVYLLSILIQIAFDHYDLIIIDCPPTINMELVKSAYIAARNLVIPVDPTKFGYLSLLKTYDWYKSARTLFNRRLHLAAIIVSMYSEKRNLDRAVYETLLETEVLNQALLKPPLPRFQDFVKSMHYSQYVASVNSEGKAAKAFVELMEALETRLEFEDTRYLLEEENSRRA